MEKDIERRLSSLESKINEILSMITIIFQRENNVIYT